MSELTNANIWSEWFPEGEFADLLAGETVVVDTGQVNGVWKKALDREVRAGRLNKWRGKWFPVAGASFGIGPDKTCYGTPEVAAFFKSSDATRMSLLPAISRALDAI